MKILAWTVVLAFQPLALFELPAAERSDAEKEAIKEIEQAGGSAREIARNDDRLDVNFQLAGDKIGDEHLAPVARLSKVYEVRLGRTKISDAGLAHLAGLKSVERLHLENTQVSDAGLEHLKGLEKLVYLNLYGAQISDAGLQHLTGLKDLKNLYVWQTKVTEAGIAQLKQSLPDLNVETGWDSTEVEEAKEVQAAQQEKNKKKEEKDN